jgi:hypothetical protein
MSSPDNPPTPDEEEKKMSTMQLVGIIIASVISGLLLIVAIIGFVYWRYKNHHIQPQDFHIYFNEEYDPNAAQKIPEYNFPKGTFNDDDS